MKPFLLILFMSLFVGCADDPDRLEGEIIETEDARYFRMKHNMGDCYFAERINFPKMKKLLKRLERQ